MTALDLTTRLRQRLGERIPPDGTEADTNFTDAEINDILLQGGNSVIRAAYIGWQIKAAEYAELVSTVEGNSAKTMSDLYAHAQSQVTQYKSLLGLGGNDLTAGRSRVGRIVRPGGMQT